MQSFPNPGAKYQVTIKDPAVARWSERGDEVLVLTTDNELFSVKVSTANGFRQGATTRLFQLAPLALLIDAEPGAQRFLTAIVKDASSFSRLEIVLGWTQLLDKGN